MARGPDNRTFCTREIVFVGKNGEYSLFPVKANNERKLIDLTVRGVDRLFISDKANVAITSDFVVVRKVVKIVQ